MLENYTYISEINVISLLTTYDLLKYNLCVCLYFRRYLESQLQVLTRDLDDNRKIKGRQTLIAVDPNDLYKRRALPSLIPIQQQPQFSLNTNPSAFQSAPSDNTHFKPVLLDANQNQAAFATLPYQQSLRPQVSTYHHSLSYPISNQQPFSIPAVTHSYSLNNRQLNPLYPNQELHGINPNNAFQNPFASGIIQKPRRQPNLLSYGMTPVMSQTISNPNTNYSRPSFLYDSKTIPFPTSNNPFSCGVTTNQMAIAQVKPNFYDGNRYSQSTGGKGRRQNIPARRKEGQGTVSAGSPFKFTFSKEKELPSISNSSDKKSEIETEDSSPDDPILMLSSTRESRSGTKFKRSQSPETVFDIEAEDRYWDAMSTKTQTILDKSS